MKRVRLKDLKKSALKKVKAKPQVIVEDEVEEVIPVKPIRAVNVTVDKGEVCSKCKHMYLHPCHGKDRSCKNFPRKSD